MSRIYKPLCVLAFMASTCTLLAVAPPPVVGQSIVSSDHELASRAGARLLSGGGNAVDAAVATALAAGVVNPAGSGLGGGGFAVVGTGKTRTTLDFREVAPAAATETMYQSDGARKDKASRVGGRAVAVPGESRGLAWLLKEHGSARPSEVAQPAIELATKGFEVRPHLAKALAKSVSDGVRRLFDLSGELARDGDRVKRPDLARTLKAWARTAGEDLHTGKGAQALAAAVERDKGVLRLTDLATYKPVERAHLEGRFHDHTLVTMGPPSSGGVVLAQVLGVLQDFDLKEMGHNSSAYIHTVTEAMKHAYADRAHHLGDPDFVEVPVQRLLSDERKQQVQRSIWPGRTFPPEHYGPLIAPPVDAGTQHISVLDANGNGVALTTTINTSFGSGLVDTSTGVILNNEMDDFVAEPGVPNAYGLIGTKANAIEPGKRPLSSMTPTLVYDADNRLVMSLGASGGSTIISSTLQVYLNIVVFGMDAQEAVAAPRFHHQWQPDKLFVEPATPADVRVALESRGHVLDVRDAFSSVQVARVREDGQLEGGADPRKGGWPARPFIR